MRILLVGSPKSVFGFDRVVRVPNLGLCSIAAQLDRRFCKVKIIDLILTEGKTIPYFTYLLRQYEPDLVGFSCMVFQYASSLELAKMTKQVNPDTKVVMGGYFPTACDEWILESEDSQYIDYIIRREGEIAFPKLIKTLLGNNNLDEVPNLSYRDNGSVIRNPNHALVDLNEIKPPDRKSRILKKGFYLGPYTGDVIETSRGCVFDCNYCSIREMYGKSFRTYSIDRILDDIRDAEKQGAESVLVTDDNITLDGKRYKEICEAITEAGLNRLYYAIQTSVRGIKQTPGLARAMGQAGTNVVFLGIENIITQNLNVLDKSNQFKESDARDVVLELREYGIVVIGGFILGNPDDNEETLWANFEFAKSTGVDVALFYILTPHPKTGIRQELIKQGLVTNLDDFSKYDGFQANVRTKYLSSEKLFALREELGWKYPIQSGSIKHMIKKWPLSFGLKLLFKELWKRPDDVLGYLKGLI